MPATLVLTSLAPMAVRRVWGHCPGQAPGGWVRQRQWEVQGGQLRALGSGRVRAPGGRAHPPRPVAWAAQRLVLASARGQARAEWVSGDKAGLLG
ncbi:MAG: hypothetical protein ACKN9W_10735 [Methylococcus sp.]